MASSPQWVSCNCCVSCCHLSLHVLSENHMQSRQMPKYEPHSGPCSNHTAPSYPSVESPVIVSHKTSGQDPNTSRSTVMSKRSNITITGATIVPRSILQRHQQSSGAHEGAHTPSCPQSTAQQTSLEALGRSGTLQFVDGSCHQ